MVILMKPEDARVIDRIMYLHKRVSKNRLGILMQQGGDSPITIVPCIDTALRDF